MRRQLLLVAGMLPLIAFSQNQDTTKNTVTNPPKSTVFELGEVRIVVSQKDSLNDRITQKDMENQNRFEVSRVLNMLPGISLTASGPRNESMVSVRGFDLRAVPVYMDGIPVYVPYDGYVDLARFTTFDLSAIDVSKGFSSLLYGPNSLGGAINLISRKPVSKFEYDGAIGMINTNGYRGNINIGSNLGKFYFQGNFSRLHREGYDMSKKFTPHAHENGDERDNSYRTDQKINFKIGWTPTENQEYVLGYINQQGEKGTPVYAGDDLQNSLFSRPRYWQWPDWDKVTYYFMSNNKFHKKHYTKSRFYYDIFKNLLSSFDDSTYTTQSRPYAFESRYDDYSYGGSIEYGTTIIPKNELKFSAHYKQDIHRENDLNEPVRKIEDNTINFALEDNYRIHKKVTIVPGISLSARKNIQADDYNSSTNEITQFASIGSSKAFNSQLGIFYSLTDNHRLDFTASHKTRFATVKDRYSYRMGTAIPNPGLKPERSDNLDFTYSGRFFDQLTLQGSVFYSHIKDAIISVSNVEPGRSQMQNTGAAEFKGVELSLKYDILKTLSLSSNYSYIDRRNLTNPTVLFSDVPYTKVFSYLQYNPIRQVRLLLSAEYNSMRYSTSYGTRSPEFTVFNAVASGQIVKNISIEAGLNNIFDRNYMLTEGYPEEGRNFFVTLRFFNH